MLPVYVHKSHQTCQIGKNIPITKKIAGWNGFGNLVNNKRVEAVRSDHIQFIL